MSCYKNDRRHMERRSTDHSNKWKLLVSMGVLFVGWSGLVYIHWLISEVA